MPIGPAGGVTAGKEWIKFDFEVAGLKETQRFIKNFGMTASNVKGSLMQFGDYMMTKFAARFKGETGRMAWVQLAPSTVRARERGYGYYAQASRQEARHMILQWTGELLRSFTQKMAYGSVFNVSETSLAVGSMLNKASYHHFGSSRLPKRQVAFIDRQDNYNLIKIFHTAMEGAIRKARSGQFGWGPPAAAGTPKWVQF